MSVCEMLRTGREILPLADLVAEAIEHTVNQMEEVNGEAFPRHLSPLKREAMTRNALSVPLS
ncbi:MAG: hypothetical protein L0H94_12670 [Nitrospira sp.]|nr:hypothetical protein [Nitrospira sp.]